MHDLWEVGYQVYLIISKGEFLKLNVKIVIAVLNLRVSRTLDKFITMIYRDDGLEQQIRLKDDIDIFKESSKPKEPVKKEKKEVTLTNAIILLKGRQKVINDLENGIFPKGKQTQGKGSETILADRKQLKMLTPK